jgi:hypothetical protein
MILFRIKILFVFGTFGGRPGHDESPRVGWGRLYNPPILSRWLPMVIPRENSWEGTGVLGVEVQGFGYPTGSPDNSKRYGI